MRQIFAVSVFLATVMLEAQTVPAQDVTASKNAVIVMDGSGSMWGRLDNSKAAKADSVREALQNVLAKDTATSRLALVGFGHRRKADCSDVETLAPLGSSHESLTDIVARYSPTGKGPLAAALKQAASTIPAGQSGRIVVIHDGVDNCQQDVCKAAADIAATRSGIAIDLVSIGLSKADLAKVSCIAEQTSGKAYDIDVADGLGPSVEEAVSAALALTHDPDASLAEETPAGPVAGTRWTVGLGASASPLAEASQWRILKSGTGEVVSETQTALFGDILPPGRYDVEVRHGLASKTVTADVSESGGGDLRVTLDAGVLNVRPIISGIQNAPLVYTSISRTSETKSDVPSAAANENKETVLWSAQRSNARLVLPAATYRVMLETGLARVVETVAVASGQESLASPALALGQITASATDRAAAPPLTGTLFSVFVDDPDSTGGLRELVRTAAPEPSFVVRPGTYTVVVKAGSAEARQRVAVGAGDQANVKLVLAAARLHVESKGISNAPSSPPAISISRMDGGDNETIRIPDASADLILPPGKYRLMARVGSANAAITKNITLNASDDVRQSLDVEGSAVTFQLSGKRGPQTYDVFWTVFDSNGTAVWRTTHPEPQIVLSPGRYTARAETRDTMKEASFEATSGSTLSVALSIE